ncbi:S1 family peptidase [Prauserella cavernicola]|uniref:Serine protease n=1 Tax=Prauserella cavernicola TaxID=2800127 RepID=A0A934QWB5_9PSEU|nr:serine protease [Prauserella cavernicola]MBK1787800.1 serine protease [Prauserella cavernicola]
MRVRSLLVGVVAAAAAALGVAAPGVAAAAEPPVTPFIVGGQPADQAYSFMASLQSGGQHFCGGSLIDPEWVVTAAHCVEGSSASEVSLRLGSTEWASGGEEAQAAEIIVHPDYGPTGTGDIALIKLDAPATSEPVAVADSAPAGTESRIMGWGQTCPESGGCGAPDELQQLDTQVVDAADCTGIDANTELCTDNPNGDSGACYGDSGGPQVVADGDGWKLIGATSRTGNNDPTCATGPSIYTSVPAYLDWIGETTGGAVAA